MDVFEAMETARAMRYLKDEPIPDDVVQRLIWAATRAPSPSNTQLWHFILVTDKTVLRELGGAVQAGMAGRLTRLPPTDEPSVLAMRHGGQVLTEHLDRTPLLVVVAAELTYPPGAPDERYIASGTLPAAQNLILAARALGLGATLTAFHQYAPDAFRQLLELPDYVRIGAVIPVGYPARDFGPVRRRPIDDVIHYEHWQVRSPD